MLFSNSVLFKEAISISIKSFFISLNFCFDSLKKTVIDNIILKNRVVQKTYRENLNEYLIKTDPVTKFITRKLLDLYFLNENVLLCWDYNDFNHEFYSLKNLIVKEVLKPEYKEYSNKAVIQCICGDKELLNKSGY